MQVAAASTPSIFNFQLSSPVRSKSAPDNPAAALRLEEDSSREIAYRLPDPSLDQTVDEATRITTALVAALNSGERVGQLLQEIV